MNENRPRGGLRRWLGAGVNLVLVTATLLAVAFFTPSLLGYERYVITGGSMSGTIEKGSVVFERLVPAEDLEVGDVITYLPPAESGVHTLVTHRIISIAWDSDGRAVLRTQGDANADPDPWKFSLLDQEQAVVEYAVPYVGHVLIALADPDLRQLVIGVPAGMVGLVALIQLAGAIWPRRREVPNCGASVDLASTASGTPITSVAPVIASLRPTPGPHRRPATAGPRIY